MKRTASGFSQRRLAAVRASERETGTRSGLRAGTGANTEDQTEESVFALDGRSEIFRELETVEPLRAPRLQWRLLCSA